MERAGGVGPDVGRHAVGAEPGEPSRDGLGIARRQEQREHPGRRDRREEVAQVERQHDRPSDVGRDVRPHRTAGPEAVRGVVRRDRVEDLAEQPPLDRLEPRRRATRPAGPTPTASPASDSGSAAAARRPHRASRDWQSANQSSSPGSSPRRSASSAGVTIDGESASPPGRPARGPSSAAAGDGPRPGPRLRLSKALPEAGVVAQERRHARRARADPRRERREQRARSGAEPAAAADQRRGPRARSGRRAARGRPRRPRPGRGRPTWGFLSRATAGRSNLARPA